MTATNADPVVLEAGGVVVRYDDRTPLFLIVRSTDRNSWLFPKGHIEPGETAMAAAIREVREETGVQAAVKAQLGHERFQHENRVLDVAFFLMDFLGTVPGDEDREIKWCTYLAAKALLSFEETKSVLQRANMTVGSTSYRQ